VRQPTSAIGMKKFAALMTAHACSADSDCDMPNPPTCGALSTQSPGARCDGGKCTYPLNTAISTCNCVQGEATLCDLNGSCDPSDPTLSHCGYQRCNVSGVNSTSWSGCAALPTPPPPVTAPCGQAGLTCCPTSAPCSPGLTCDPASNTCGVCRSGDSRACVGATGCAGGRQTCGADRNWSACQGAPDPVCPPGWTADAAGSCSFQGTASMQMADTNPGYDFGKLGVGFQTYGGAIHSSISFDYVTGGCWSSSDTHDAIALTCEKGVPEQLVQCETGSGGKAGCKSGVGTRDDVGGWCRLKQIKGWTPPLQGTCIKKATLTTTANIGRRCQW
jgi:hypothetical protein